MQLLFVHISHKIPGPNLPEHTQAQSSPKVHKIPEGLLLLRDFVGLETKGGKKPKKSPHNTGRSDPASIKINNSWKSAFHFF